MRGAPHPGCTWEAQPAVGKTQPMQVWIQLLDLTSLQTLGWRLWNENPANTQSEVLFKLTSLQISWWCEVHSEGHEWPQTLSECGAEKVVSAPSCSPFLLPLFPSWTNYRSSLCLPLQGWEQHMDISMHIHRPECLLTFNKEQNKQKWVLTWMPVTQCSQGRKARPSAIP